MRRRCAEAVRRSRSRRMKLGGQAKSLLKLAVGLCILAVVISWQPLEAYAGVRELLSLLPVALAYALRACRAWPHVPCRP